MRCPLQDREHSEILLDYCCRKATPETSALLERHFEQCAACRAFAQGQQAVWRALDSWEAQPVADDFDERLYARIDGQEKRGWWSRLVGDTFSWKPAVPVAAACATAALALLLNVPAERPASPDVQESMRLESLDVDQLERAAEDVEMLRQFSTPGGTQTL